MRGDLHLHNIRRHLSDSSESLSKDIAARKDDEASTKCVKFSSWGSYGCAPHPHHVNVALGLLVLTTREPLLRSGFPVRGSVAKCLRGSRACLIYQLNASQHRTSLPNCPGPSHTPEPNSAWSPSVAPFPGVSGRLDGEEEDALPGQSDPGQSRELSGNHRHIGVNWLTSVPERTLNSLNAQLLRGAQVPATHSGFSACSKVLAGAVLP